MIDMSRNEEWNKKHEISKDDVAESLAEALVEMTEQMNLPTQIAIILPVYGTVFMKRLFDKVTPKTPPCAEELAQNYQKGELK